MARFGVFDDFELIRDANGQRRQMEKRKSRLQKLMEHSMETEKSSALGNAEMVDKLQASTRKDADMMGTLKTRVVVTRVPQDEMFEPIKTAFATAANDLHDVFSFDNFFQRPRVRNQWGLLNFDNLKPVLEAASLQPEHQVLMLEPMGSLGLGSQFAEAMRGEGMLMPHVASHAYGEEPTATLFDMVVELGLLDAVAMGGEGAGKLRIAELQRASKRVSEMLKPGAKWISVSAVPPGRRVPLLEHLGGYAFDVPNATATGVHVITLRTEPTVEEKNSTQLRGNALSTLGVENVVNLPFQGQRGPQAFAYRLNRNEKSSQRPDGGKKEDLEEFGKIVEEQHYPLMHEEM